MLENKDNIDEVWTGSRWEGKSLTASQWPVACEDDLYESNVGVVCGHYFLGGWHWGGGPLRLA